MTNINLPLGTRTRSATHFAIRIARLDAEAMGLLGKPYQAFTAQYHAALNRNIPFMFSFPQWWAWWQTDDRWGKRGLKGNGLVMARFGDVGPYAEWNVYCATAGQNGRDADHTDNVNAIKRWHRQRKESGLPWHLAVRGDGHPKSKAVITEDGTRYGSIALASEARGISRQAGFYKVRKGEWRLDTAGGSGWPGNRP